MDLSNDLISQFVKITNDNSTGSKESTVYGTTVEYNGEMYVKIDGSDLLTPVETTADMQADERVTIMIKDHSATVTGNITSPSANAGTVDKKVTEAVDGIEGKVITEVEILIADRVSTEQLDAEVARIDMLIAGKASIEELEAIDAKIENLEVGNLDAVNAKIENLKATKAEIEDLKATNADIEILDAEFADIKTLVNGNLTSDNILSFHITADKVTMDDAFISDAMIANVSAGKLTSGSINTNLVSVQSEDGALTINGSTQQFKDADGNVRIQIGKDSTGDFTFALYGADGQGQLINQNGITASAIGDGLIVNDMVSDNAAISGGKLDISSVITEINNDGSTTIKSNKIYLDEQNQSLEVAFNSLKTQVETIKDVTISGDLSYIVEQVQSNTTQIEANKESINTLVAEDTVIKQQITNLDGDIVEVNETLTAKYTTLEQTVSGFKTEVADTYATKSTVNALSDNLSTNYSTTKAMNSAIEQSASNITSSVSSTYATKEAVTNLETNLTTNYSTTSEMNSAISQSASNITSTVSSTYQKKSDMSSYPTTTQMNSAISQSASNITSSVSSTYATKSELNDEVTTLENSMSTVEQTADKINWVVSSGTSSSTMTLTDKVYNLVSDNITLTADHIDLHGYITANGGFSIDTNGNMTAVNAEFSGNITGSTFSSTNDIFQVLSDGTIETNYLSVNGTISTEILDVGHIYNPKYPACLSENTIVYISTSSSGVTDYKDFFNGCAFTSFRELLDVVPANLNGNRLDIYMQTSVTENVILDKFFGGECFIHMQGYTIYGYLRLYNPSMIFKVYGDKNTSVGTTTHGKIMPTVGSSHYSYAYDISCMYGSFYLYDIEVYPTKNNTTNTGGIYFGGFARGYVNGLYLMGGSGGMRHAVRAYEGSTVYVAASSGRANNAAFAANSGSTMTLKPTSQAGTTASTPTLTGENAEIRSTGVTFSSASNSGSNTSTSTTTTVTRTKTVFSTYADTYRSTVYYNWKSDGTVRQGDYGYGDCQGYWFFGNSLYEAMNLGTPTKVVIKVTRQTGGTSAAQTHTLKCHNYTTRPSGTPSYSDTLTTFSCAVGSTATITITNSTQLNKLKSCKGLGLSIGTTSSPYSVCSGSCSVTVTYTTTA